MDYKQKYLKYKYKYLKLKGGDPPEETDFENKAKFKEIGSGMQGTVYNLLGTIYAYKVFRNITPLTKWGPKNSNILGDELYFGGIRIDIFNNIGYRYKKASDLGLGPHFYKCYTFTTDVTYGVIIMGCIYGNTIKELRDTNNLTSDIERRYNEVCYELEKNGLIDSDSHENNFMVERDTGRVFGIDF